MKALVELAFLLTIRQRAKQTKQYTGSGQNTSQSTTIKQSFKKQDNFNQLQHGLPFLVAFI